MQHKILVQASSFQNLHVEDCEAQGVDPESAYVCRTIDIPDDEDMPDDFLQAAKFAEEAEDGQQVAFDLTRVQPILGSYRHLAMTFPNGEIKVIRYLVGLRRLYYWLTLTNVPGKGGGSSNLGPFPMPGETVLEQCYFEHPPGQLIGLPTEKERNHLHDLVLTAPISVVRKALEALRPRVESGDVVVIDVDPSQMRGEFMVNDGQHRHATTPRREENDHDI